MRDRRKQKGDNNMAVCPDFKRLLKNSQIAKKSLQTFEMERMNLIAGNHQEYRTETLQTTDRVSAHMPAHTTVRVFFPITEYLLYLTDRSIRVSPAPEQRPFYGRQWRYCLW